jgi:membrane-associated phospholipid phosphatase
MTDDISCQSTDDGSSFLLLDVEQIKKGEIDHQKNKKHSQIKNLLTRIDLFDKKISNNIYELELNIILENIIHMFGRLFNVDIVLIFYISVFIYQSFFNKNYYYIIKPFIHLSLIFILSTILKYIIKRPRPDINKNVKRLYNLRKKEKNFSMPSGDSMQAANFAIIALFYFNVSYLGFIVVPFVMFARIFYFCHYFFDTLIGALIGGFVSFGLVFPLRCLNF